LGLRDRRLQTTLDFTRGQTDLAHSPRGWTGARTPSAIKNVRQAQRRRAVNQPRRAAAKTLVTRALATATETATNGGDAQEVQAAVRRAVSALDRAAKIGAIHTNAANRRKSRLMLKVNAALGGEIAAAPAQARSTGKAQAAKQARVRIAASKASKAKGEQTAAGKARAALARSTRAASETKRAAAEAEPAAATTPSGRASSAKSTAKATRKTVAKTAATGTVAKGKVTAAKADKATAAKGKATAAKADKGATAAKASRSRAK
jgi:small subunit ribosomal protein S20